MKEIIELNCMGMKCPRPIIEIVRSARKSPGSTISVITDDFTFESDVKVWIDNAGANLIQLERDEKVIKVQIQLQN